MNRNPSLVLIVACLFAVSPALLELASSLTYTGANRFIVLTPLLVALQARREARSPDRWSRAGLLCLLLAVVAELVGIAGHSWSLARLSIPLCFLGISCIAGWPRFRTAALGFWVLPPPTFVVSLPSPGVESLLARLAAQVLQVFGANVNALGPVLESHDLRLELTVASAGVPSAVLLAQLGWYRALSRDASFLGSIQNAALWAVGAIPLQVLGVLAATIALIAGRPAWGQVGLEQGLGFLVAATVIARTELRRNAASRGEME